MRIQYVGFWDPVFLCLARTTEEKLGYFSQGCINSDSSLLNLSFFSPPVLLEYPFPLFDNTSFCFSWSLAVLNKSPYSHSPFWIPIFFLFLRIKKNIQHLMFGTGWRFIIKTCLFWLIPANGWMAAFSQTAASSLTALCNLVTEQRVH